MSEGGRPVFWDTEVDGRTRYVRLNPIMGVEVRRRPSRVLVVAVRGGCRRGERMFLEQRQAGPDDSEHVQRSRRPPRARPRRRTHHDRHAYDRQAHQHDSGVPGRDHRHPEGRTPSPGRGQQLHRVLARGELRGPGPGGDTSRRHDDVRRVESGQSGESPTRCHGCRRHRLPRESRQPAGDGGFRRIGQADRAQQLPTCRQDGPAITSSRSRPGKTVVPPKRNPPPPYELQGAHVLEQRRGTGCSSAPPRTPAGPAPAENSGTSSTGELSAYG